MATERLFATLRFLCSSILKCLGRSHDEWSAPLLPNVEFLSFLEKEKPALPVEDTPRRVIVRLPDLFSASFGLVRNPPMNPHFEAVKEQSEAWLAQTASLDARMQAFVRKVNFSFCSSMIVPEASPEGFLTFALWGDWIFPFDDPFDDGLIRDAEEAQDAVDSMLAIMYPGSYTKKPTPIDGLIAAHDDYWLRVQASCPPSVARRYAETMKRYGTGLVDQFKNELAGRKMNSTVEEIMETRQLTVGAEPFFPLIELALGLRIPDEVFEHWTIKEFERITNEICIIVNDTVSYRKEEVIGHGHNMVAAARRSGMTAQQAFDHIGAMLEARFNDWTRAYAALPSWGEEVDGDVRAYVQGVKNVAIATTVWSFSSQRYFGSTTATVRETMITDVLADV